MTVLTVNFNSIIDLSDDQFFQLCQANKNLKFERNNYGEIIIMSPAGGETGNRNGRLNQQLFNWADTNNTGIAFDSSTGFKLPNGANRSPDAAWIKLERWNALTEEEKQKFPPLCPDFVVELLSPSDNLKDAQNKMKEYQENGAFLGWLINRQSRQVEIYRPNLDIEILDNPRSISGEPLLADFVLDLDKIW